MPQSCASCGANLGMTPFDAEMSEILYGDLATEVTDLRGKRCAVCGETEYDPDSGRRYAEAGDALVMEARRRPE